MSYPEPSSQIAGILANTLRSVLPELCVQRYGLALPFDCAPVPDGSSWTVRVQIGNAEAPRLTARFNIRHVGGNMYDVRADVEDGPSTSFCYCLSETEPLLVPKVPHLAWQGAAFLLDTLERRVGRRLLSETALGRRSALHRPSPPSAAQPVRSDP
jgi:hypothetical protein